MAFAGFCPETLEFLALVKLHDSKAWYDEHKPDYRRLLTDPFAALLSDLTTVFADIDPALDTNPKRCFSRIRRDTRFSKDKTQYRDNMWMSVKCTMDEWFDHPTFFFEITPVSFRYGMGYYAATPRTMERFRAAVTRDIEGFRQVVRSALAWFEVAGEMYKRDKDPTLPEDIRLWHNRRELYVVHTGHPVSQLYEPALVDELRAGFARLAPLYHFLMRLSAD